MRSGLPGDERSHGCRQPGSSRCETVKPTSPAFGLAPRPVAPSSRISPPEPVAAPGNGEIAVGWLCVSTLIAMCAGSCEYAVDARSPHRARTSDASAPATTAALSLYADSTPCRRARVRVADHREQALRRTLAVDDPVGVEDLVPAMLGVRLREHHELDVGRVALQRRELRREIVDLVARQREAELAVGALERGAPAREHVDGAHRPRRVRGEQQLLAAARSVQQRLRHAIVQQRRDALAARRP